MNHELRHIRDENRFEISIEKSDFSKGGTNLNFLCQLRDEEAFPLCLFFDVRPAVVMQSIHVKRDTLTVPQTYDPKTTTLGAILGTPN